MTLQNCRKQASKQGLAVIAQRFHLDSQIVLLAVRGDGVAHPVPCVTHA
jgi:hypothetical protein